MKNSLRLLSGVSNKKIDKAYNLLKRQWPRIIPQLEHGFLTKDEVQKILDLSELRVIREATAGEKTRDERSTDICWIDPGQESDWIFSKLDSLGQKMNEIYKLDLLGFFESLQVGTYGEGQKFDWHADNDGYPLRKLTISIQLSNDTDYEGGNLEFMDGPHVRAAPREKDAAVIFPSQMMHRVTPITGGIRQSLVVWLSGPPLK